MREPIANIEVEKKLLCILLGENSGFVFTEITGIINATDFYRSEHQRIYQTMLELHRQGVQIDSYVVETELSQKGVKGIDRGYLRGLMGLEHSASRANYFAKVVRSEAQRRRLKEYGQKIAELAERDMPVEELRHIADMDLMAISRRGVTGGVMEIGDVMIAAMERLTKLQSEGSQGVPSGYADLDKVLSGFQAGDMVILAARPSVGKTALALNMGLNAARNGKRVLIFSLEMSRVQLGLRLMSNLSGINGQYLNSGNLQESEMLQLAEVAGELSKLKLSMDETAGQSLMEMRSKARRLQYELGLDMVIIDYLQLMQGGKAENRQQEISEISRGIKAMARELNVPVLALSQLSRSVEMRAEKKPMLSDLRESGSLEQDADVVMFLYREEYYNRDDPTNENIAEVIIAKNRNGPTTTVRLHFDKSTMKFGNLTRVVD